MFVCQCFGSLSFCRLAPAFVSSCLLQLIVHESCYASAPVVRLSHVFHMFSPVFTKRFRFIRLYHMFIFSLVVPLRNIYRLPLWFPHANAVLELNTSSDRLVSGRLGMTRICRGKSVVYTSENEHVSHFFFFQFQPLV